MRAKLVPFLFILTTILLAACGPSVQTAIPEPVPSSSLPAIETDPDIILSILNNDPFVYLEDLAAETYAGEAFARPGTVEFTVTIDGNTPPVLVKYSWCAVDQATLDQNIQHVSPYFFYDGQEIPSDQFNVFDSRSGDQVCSLLGALFSEWPAGQHQIRIETTIDEQINDGASDYPAGDYIEVYNITVIP